MNAMTTATAAKPSPAAEILELIVAPFFFGEVEVDDAEAAVAEPVWVPLAEGVADAGGYVEPRALISKG